MKLRLKDAVERLRAVRHLYLCVRAKEDRSYEKALKHYEGFRRVGWEKHHHQAFAADLQLLLGNGREALKVYLKVIDELEAEASVTRSINAEYTLAYSKMRLAGLRGEEELRASFRGSVLALRPPMYVRKLLPVEYE
jgi:uncharacterized protein VirK/YbjX